MLECWKCKNSYEESEVAFKLKDGSCMCKICHGKDELLEELRNVTEDKGRPFSVGSFTLHTDERNTIICPHCGAIEGPDYSESEHFTGEAGEWKEQECQECEAPYELEVVVIHERRTRKIVTDKMVEADWVKRNA